MMADILAALLVLKGYDVSLDKVITGIRNG